MFLLNPIHGTGCFRILLALLFSMPLCVHAETGSESRISFKKTLIDSKFRSEGVAVADFNRDGKQDIVAGRVLYLAPEWKLYSLESTVRDFSPKDYSGSFANFTHDVNHDGWPDVILVDFPGTPTYWYENPQKLGLPWKRHICVPVSNNESPLFRDLDGDGNPELILATAPTTEQSDGPDRFMAFFTPQATSVMPWKVHRISQNAVPGTRKYSHGLGLGDINLDGRLDILIKEGWWESPENPNGQTWTFHSANWGEDSAQMFAYDFDGDGDQDILSSSAHRYGIWWHEQISGNWKTHIIDQSYSQTHGLCLADVNGDGLPDFVTGKRWYAHGGRDPGGNDPAVFFWYELRRSGTHPEWIRHPIDSNSGPGTQFEVQDVNQDGMLDVVTSNKKGTHLFLQERN